MQCQCLCQPLQLKFAFLKCTLRRGLIVRERLERSSGSQAPVLRSAGLKKGLCMEPKRNPSIIQGDMAAKPSFAEPEFKFLRWLAERPHVDMEDFTSKAIATDKLAERFDIEGWIEVRTTTALGGGPRITHSADGVMEISCAPVREGEWFSPIQMGEPWWPYFFTDTLRKVRRPHWKQRLNEFCSGVAELFQDCGRAPVEMRVTPAGRRALIEHETLPAAKSKATAPHRSRAGTGAISLAGKALEAWQTMHPNSSPYHPSRRKLRPDVYDWIKDHGPEGYNLPSRGSFERYIREWERQQ